MYLAGKSDFGKPVKNFSDICAWAFTTHGILCLTTCMPAVPTIGADLNRLTAVTQMMAHLNNISKLILPGNMNKLHSWYWHQVWRSFPETVSHTIIAGVRITQMKFLSTGMMLCRCFRMFGSNTAMAQPGLLVHRAISARDFHIMNLGIFCPT